MRIWLARVVLPAWLAMYLLIFRGFSVFLYLPLISVWGIWLTALVIFLVLGIWSTGLYLILITEEGFEKVGAHLARLKEKQEKGIMAWIRARFPRKDDRPILSPIWIMATFVVLDVLVGTLAVRLSYPKERYRNAIILIWLGCAVEIVTWFVPYYGGIYTIFKVIVARLA